MSIKKVLAYSATGAQGRPAAYRFVLAGFQTRVLTRDESHAGDLAAAGADVVEGDLDHVGSVRDASEGVDAVYLLLPASSGDPGSRERRAATAIDAAKDAGARLIVWSASRPLGAGEGAGDRPDPQLRIREHLQESGVPHVILQPAPYLENLLAPWTAPRVAEEDVLQVPHPATMKTQWTAAGDVGALAVEAFRRPEVADDQLFAVSTEPLDGPGLAAAFTRALGREIRYEALDPQRFGEMLGRARGEQTGRMAAQRCQQIFDDPDAHELDVDMGPVLEKLPATLTPLEVWVRRHAEAFGGARS